MSTPHPNPAFETVTVPRQSLEAANALLGLIECASDLLRERGFGDGSPVRQLDIAYATTRNALLAESDGAIERAHRIERGEAQP